MRIQSMLGLVAVLGTFGCGSGNSGGGDSPGEGEKSKEYSLSSLKAKTPELPNIRPEGFQNNSGTREEYLAAMQKKPLKASKTKRDSLLEKLQKRVVKDVRPQDQSVWLDAFDKSLPLSSEIECSGLLHYVSKNLFVTTQFNAGEGSLEQLVGDLKRSCNDVPVGDPNGSDVNWTCVETSIDERSFQREYSTAGLVSGPVWEYTLDGSSIETIYLNTGSEGKVPGGRKSGTFIDFDTETLNSAKTKFADLHGDSIFFQATSTEKVLISGGITLAIEYVNDREFISKSKEARRTTESFVAKEIDNETIRIEVKKEVEKTGDSKKFHGEYEITRKAGDKTCVIKTINQ